MTDGERARCANYRQRNRVKLAAKWRDYYQRNKLSLNLKQRLRTDRAQLKTEGRRKLSAWYVRTVLIRRTRLRPSDIPDSLVDLYREIIRTKRQL